MLIRFGVQNFRSFEGDALFSMIPGRAQQHADHILRPAQVDFELLPMALLYGANASGKSNLVRAMAFARNLIVNGTRPKQTLDVQPFRLCKNPDAVPSRFEFEFIAAGQAYAYGFVLDQHRIQEEWLYLIQREKEVEEVIFERKTDKEGVIKATFSEKRLGDVEEQFLQFVARGTRPNQLLFSELIENNVVALDRVDRWFRHVLTIVFPDSRFAGVEIGVHADHEFAQALAQFLHGLHTGIDEVRLKDVDIDSLGFPSNLLAELKLELGQELKGNNGESASAYVVLEAPQKQRYMFRRVADNGIAGYSLATVRHVSDQEIVFELSEESDGTQRLLDLFPVLHASENKVFVIDELERSLHPNLVRQFIQVFLNSAGDNQLIVTTHESTLLDLSLLRRDEIWFVEKSPKGASILYSLEEFKIRHDLDIRKGYLQGRFGAIPVFNSALLSELREE